MKFPFYEVKTKMYKLDFSMIRTVRVPHQQFKAIKNKARHLIVEDKNNGEILLFCRANFDEDVKTKYGCSIYGETEL